MKLWRIAADTRDYAATDLTGAGAAKYPGRWNDEGQPVVYAAPTIAVAVLETAAHVNSTGLPLNRYLLELDVPDDVWALRKEISLSSLGPTWSAIPSGHATATVGSAWLQSMDSPILLVPSVIVPEEPAALINPRHRASALITASVVRLFEYNRLFRG